MQSTWNTDFETFKDSTLESQSDDAVLADDDDTSESWTQPWDLPAGMSCAAHSSTTGSEGDLRGVAAAVIQNTPSEHLNAKG